MNPTPVVDPNTFDRDATTLAFQRSPGNVSPDTDAATFSTNTVGGGVTWGDAVP